MKVKIEWPITPDAYPTYKNFVCLYKAKRKVRENAKKAGLEILNVTEFRVKLNQLQALQRLFDCGMWYDTVRY